MAYHPTRLMLVALALVACQKKPAERFATQSVTRGPMTETISATGEITARRRVNIGSQVSGTIAQVHVDFNDAVHAGEVLAEVSPQVFVAQAARAQASLAVAQADVDRARLELSDAQRTQRRHAKLARDEMLAAADSDKSDVAVEAAQANLKRAQAIVMQVQADRDQAQASLGLTKIRSPIDGVVLDRQVEVGQTVAAQFQVATLFVVVGDMQKVHVIVNIDEADVGEIKPGMPVQFDVDAYPQTHFSGVLHSLRQAPVGMSQTPASTTGVVTYAAIIEADNPSAQLMQGMTAQASIQKAHVDDAIRLPLAALRFAPAELLDKQGPAGRARGQAAGRIFVLEGGKASERAVTLGISDGRFVEARGGASENDVVIVGELHAADAGKKKGPRRVGR